MHYQSSFDGSVVHLASLKIMVNAELPDNGSKVVVMALESGSVVIDAAQHRDHALQRVQRGWDDTHISPRSCPSAGAKLCTYHRWFSRPNPQVTEPYFELPLSRRSLGQLFRFRLSSHSLPIEQGRRAKLPRAMRFCPLCPGHHVGMRGIWFLSAQHCSTFGSIMPTSIQMHILR